MAKNKKPTLIISKESRDELHKVGEELEDSLNAFNKSMYSDDFCCKVLAYTLCFGGGNEQIVYGSISFAVKIAQKRLNLFGGEIPNVKLLGLFSQRVKELSQTGSKTVWLSELKERFDLLIPDYDSLPEYAPSKNIVNGYVHYENSLLDLLLLF